MGSGSPIRPDEVAGVKRSNIPPEVFDSVNELIARNFSNGRAMVKQSDVVNLICAKHQQARTNSSLIYSNGWLNFEEAYRAEGWQVKYDKPGYNEDYSAYWVFEQ